MVPLKWAVGRSLLTLICWIDAIAERFCPIESKDVVMPNVCAMCISRLHIQREFLSDNFIISFFISYPFIRIITSNECCGYEKLISCCFKRKNHCGPWCRRRNMRQITDATCTSESICSFAHSEKFDRGNRYEMNIGIVRFRSMKLSFVFFFFFRLLHSAKRDIFQFKYRNERESRCIRTDSLYHEYFSEWTKLYFSEAKWNVKENILRWKFVNKNNDMRDSFEVCISSIFTFFLFAFSFDV